MGRKELVNFEEANNEVAFAALHPLGTVAEKVCVLGWGGGKAVLCWFRGRES